MHKNINQRRDSKWEEAISQYTNTLKKRPTLSIQQQSPELQQQEQQQQPEQPNSRRINRG
jgi:hypothetical protein